MKLFIAAVFIILVGCLSSSCAPTYFYHFPTEGELKTYHIDSVRWKYAANSITQIPVSDDAGKLYWLDVTDKTKIEVKTTEGVLYRFYLQSLVVTNNELGLFGPSAIWTGYDLLTHSNRSVMAREVSTIAVLSNEKAAHQIPKP
jgi:hypothetical protein